MGISFEARKAIIINNKRIAMKKLILLLLLSASATCFGMEGMQKMWRNYWRQRKIEYIEKRVNILAKNMQACVSVSDWQLSKKIDWHIEECG